MPIIVISLLYLTIIILGTLLVGSSLLIITIPLVLIPLILMAWIGDRILLYLLGAKECHLMADHKVRQITENHAFKLDFNTVPEIYTYDSSSNRAFMIKKSNRCAIVLPDDLMEKEKVDILRFLIWDLMIDAKLGRSRTLTLAMSAQVLSWYPFIVIEKFISIFFQGTRLNHILNLMGVYFSLPLGKFSRLFSLNETYEAEKERIIKLVPEWSDFVRLQKIRTQHEVVKFDQYDMIFNELEHIKSGTKHSLRRSLEAIV